MWKAFLAMRPASLAMGPLEPNPLLHQVGQGRDGQVLGWPIRAIQQQSAWAVPEASTAPLGIEKGQPGLPAQAGDGLPGKVDQGEAP